MPLNQVQRLDTRDRIFLEKAALGHPFHHHEFLLQRFRPFRGEPPAVAGFLLYPDSPAKMKTTSQEAFCFKPIPQQDRGKGHRTVHNMHQHHTVLSRQDKRKTGGQLQKDNQSETSSVSDKPNQETTDMQSQYQKDFPAPMSCCRRRTPVLPQPDNIGINPAFRIDFSTVQRETFPGWPIGNPMFNKLTASSNGQQNKTFER